MDIRTITAMKIPISLMTIPEFTIPTGIEIPSPIDMSGAFDNPVATPTSIDMSEASNNPVSAYTPDFSALNDEAGASAYTPPPIDMSGALDNSIATPTSIDMSEASNNPVSAYTPPPFDTSVIPIGATSLPPFDTSYQSIMPIEYIPSPDVSVWVPDFTELDELMRKSRAEMAETQKYIDDMIAVARKRMADAMAEHKKRIEVIRQIEADARARMDKAIADMRAHRIALKIMNKAAIEKMKAGQAALVNIQLRNMTTEPIDAKVKMSALDNLTDLFTAHMNPGETVVVPHTVDLADKMRFSVSEIVGE